MINEQQTLKIPPIMNLYCQHEIQPSQNQHPNKSREGWGGGGHTVCSESKIMETIPYLDEKS